MDQSVKAVASASGVTQKVYVKQCCAECGSDEVSRDGSLRWNLAQQIWEHGGDLEAALCDECGHEELTEIALTDIELFKAQFDAFEAALQKQAPKMISTLASILGVKTSTAGPQSLVTEFHERARGAIAEAVDAASEQAGTPFVIVHLRMLLDLIIFSYSNFYTDAYEYRETVKALRRRISVLRQSATRDGVLNSAIADYVPVSVELFRQVDDLAHRDIYIDDAYFSIGISRFKAAIASIRKLI